MPPRYSCRHCQATSYREVIQRDALGKMQRNGLYRCSGCSVVFADPNAWRQVNEHSGDSGQSDRSEAAMRTPNFKTGWMMPPGSG
jgi:hypothetical protein